MKRNVTLEPQVKQNNEECVVDPYTPCEGLSETVCSLRKDCFPLYGNPCEDFHKKEFIYCQESVYVRKGWQTTKNFFF